MKHPLKIDSEKQTTRQLSYGAHDLILKIFRKMSGMDFPHPLDEFPESHQDDPGEAVLTSNIIFGQLSDGKWSLIYSRVGRKELTPDDVANLAIPANARFLVADCRNEAKIDGLGRFVWEIKVSWRRSDA